MENYIEFQVYCNSDIKELLIAELAEEQYEGFVEDEYGFSAYISTPLFNRDVFEQLLTKYGIEPDKVPQKSIARQNWNAQWEASYEPIIIADKILIKAPFHQLTEHYEYVVTIQPKNNFGTGHHATTQLMLELMLNLNVNQQHVLDYGCGTGVLGIMALKMGAAHVKGIDIDEWCLDNIEENKNKLTEREYYMLIASLLYAVDKVANTVGHYDAYFKKEYTNGEFFMKPIDPIKVEEVSIFREDANLLVKRIKTDVAYIDPPYNSRQYSRFYHVLETLTKWDKPKLYGVALKPKPENMSDYCRSSAKTRLAELVRDIDAKYLVVSYNNTYDSKSNSSKNKITLQEIEKILQKKGKTKVFEKEYRHFNAGNTNFTNHKEYLFVTKV